VKAKKAAGKDQTSLMNVPRISVDPGDSGALSIYVIRHVVHMKRILMALFCSDFIRIPIHTLAM
jgi:hypothetical protein